MSSNKKLNVENMQPNILYFSKQCAHSDKFRQMLMKKPDLESTFIQLCVDGGGKLPSYVRSVPFIVVHDTKGQQMRLTDGSAFQWLHKQMEQLQGDFAAYDLGVMSSCLSDTYSFISDNGTTQAPVGHTFEWINKEKPFDGTFGINTPNESTFGGGVNKPPKTDMEKLVEDRNRDLPQFKKPDSIDFTKPLNAPKRAEASYTPQVRRQEAKIAPSKRGVDFQNPNFKPNQPIRRAVVKKPVNQPIHRAPVKNNAPRPAIRGRALPAGWNRMS